MEKMQEYGKEPAPPTVPPRPAAVLPLRVELAMKVLDNLTHHLYNATCVDEDEPWKPPGKAMAPSDMEPLRDLIGASAAAVQAYIDGIWTP